MTNSRTLANGDFITPAMADYLKVIFDLEKKDGVARVKGIAASLDVENSSVTCMLKKLARYKLVKYRKYEYVVLTDAGFHIGTIMQNRYEVLFRFLTEILTIDQKSAASEARKMMHLLAPDTVESLEDVMGYMKSCPNAGGTWPVRFHEFRRTGRRRIICENPDAGHASL